MGHSSGPRSAMCIRASLQDSDGNCTLLRGWGAATPLPPSLVLVKITRRKQGLHGKLYCRYRALDLGLRNTKVYGGRERHPPDLEAWEQASDVKLSSPFINHHEIWGRSSFTPQTQSSPQTPSSSGRQLGESGWRGPAGGWNHLET